MRWRTDRLPQFQNRILRWFLAILSVFSTFLPAPPLLFFPLPLPLLFLLLLLRTNSPDAELKLGSHSSWLLRERRLLFELEYSMFGLQVSWVNSRHTGRAQIPVKRHDLCAAPHAVPRSRLAPPTMQVHRHVKYHLHLRPWCTHCAGAPVRLYSGCPGGRVQ